MSSQEFSPAPYPIYAETGTGDDYALPEPRTRERYWLYGLLFAATLLTTTAAGAAMQIDFQSRSALRRGAGILQSVSLVLAIHPIALLQGLPFSLTLMSILLAHEFGHYLAAVFHRVDSSLPYFLPSPLLGTFGAFIRIRSPIYSKRALFDIGVSGPDRRLRISASGALYRTGIFQSSARDRPSRQHDFRDPLYCSVFSNG